MGDGLQVLIDPVHSNVAPSRDPVYSRPGDNQVQGPEKFSHFILNYSRVRLILCSHFLLPQSWEMALLFSHQPSVLPSTSSLRACTSVS